MKADIMSKLIPIPCLPVGGARVVTHRYERGAGFYDSCMLAHVLWQRTRGPDAIWTASWAPGQPLRVKYSPQPWTAQLCIARILEKMARTPFRYIR